mmetsp:Transcript_77526/g.209540  ORF Transcript_77526/g.209540 Transcript_77526/m.209540 type:complete len:388 (+) Transcript_77526:426-1589(+)
MEPSVRRSSPLPLALPSRNWPLYFEPSGHVMTPGPSRMPLTYSPSKVVPSKQCSLPLPCLTSSRHSLSYRVPSDRVSTPWPCLFRLRNWPVYVERLYVAVPCPSLGVRWSSAWPGARPGAITPRFLDFSKYSTQCDTFVRQPADFRRNEKVRLDVFSTNALSERSGIKLTFELSSAWNFSNSELARPPRRSSTSSRSSPVAPPLPPQTWIVKFFASTFSTRSYGLPLVATLVQVMPCRSCSSFWAYHASSWPLMSSSSRLMPCSTPPPCREVLLPNSLSEPLLSQPLLVASAGDLAGGAPPPGSRCSGSLSGSLAPSAPGTPASGPSRLGRSVASARSWSSAADVAPVPSEGRSEGPSLSWASARLAPSASPRSSPAAPGASWAASS